MGDQVVTVSIMELLDWLAGYGGKMFPNLQEEDTILSCSIEDGMVSFLIGLEEETL